MYRNNQCNKFQEAATVDGNTNLAQKVENFNVSPQVQNNSHQQLIGIVVPKKERQRVSFTDYQTDKFNKYFHTQMLKKSQDSPLTLKSEKHLNNKQKNFSLNPILEKISEKKNRSIPNPLNQNLWEKPQEVYVKQKKKVYNDDLSNYEQKVYKNRNQIYLPKNNQNLLLEQVEIQEVPVYKKKYKKFTNKNNQKLDFVNPQLIKEERMYNLDQLSQLRKKQNLIDNTLNLDSKIMDINSISNINNRYETNNTEQEIVQQLNKTIYDTKMVQQIKDNKQSKSNQNQNEQQQEAPLVVDYSDIFPLIKDALLLIMGQFTQFFKDVQNKKKRDKLHNKYVNAENQQLIKIKFPFGVEINIARATYTFIKKLIFWYALYYIFKKLFTSN